MDELGVRPGSVIATSLVEDCAVAARTLLKGCVSPWGLAASGDRGGYHNLWTRDSMITALGILRDGDEELESAVLTSLCTLADHQNELGLLPNKIDFGDEKRVNFRAYADGGLWFAVVAATYARLRPSEQENERLLVAAERALHYYRYQDHDQSGLISIDEGTTWMDLFPLRGKSIYVNALRHLASRELGTTLTQRGQVEAGTALLSEARRSAVAINEKLWYEPGKDLAHLLTDSFSTSSYDAAGYDALGRQLLLPEKRMLADERYFLAYLTLRDFGEWFDSFGNLLTVASGLADADQTDNILTFIEKYELAAPYPMMAMYPPLRPGDADWRYYFHFGDLNMPNEYHNGGSWPMVGGWYVEALAKVGKEEAAATALENLAAANFHEKFDGFSFTEHRHGEEGTPLGMQDQAWSAGAYLMAYHAVQAMQKTAAERPMAFSA